jgi:hypothetical protein
MTGAPPRSVIPHRYVQWLVTTPTMVYILSKISDFTPLQTAIAIGMDVGMILSGLMANFLPGPYSKCERRARQGWVGVLTVWRVRSKAGARLEGRDVAAPAAACNRELCGPLLCKGWSTAVISANRRSGLLVSQSGSTVTSGALYPLGRGTALPCSKQ